MTPTRRGPGRPRDSEHDDRIMQAVLGMIRADEPITVNSVVEASGVSRAALYRRFSSLTELIAKALDHGRGPVQLDLSLSVKEALEKALFEHPKDTRGAAYSDKYFRKRMQLVMEDSNLQQAYWDAHVNRRRRTMVEALNVGIERGELRKDLNVEAAIDAINGMFYYQALVRGISMTSPESIRRVRAAFNMLWEGMKA